MKKALFLLLLICSVVVYAQKLIKGTVKTYKGEPIEGASVYLNNTTIGTVSKKDGSFELIVREGTYDLVVSFLGYKTITNSINVETYVIPYKFILVPATNFLDEVDVTKTKYDDDWRYNLQQFKRHFLGSTKLAATCEILNPKTLHFEFDLLTGILTADAREPLQIKNKGLGYLIEYDLVSFKLTRKSVTYLGRVKYFELKGGKSKQKRWNKNRLKAFNGSRMHFIRSLRNQSLKEEGFIVNQFKRVKNENRPSEAAIKKARKKIRSNRAVLNFSKDLSNPKTELDSAMLVLRKARLPKFRDYLYKKDVPYTDMIVAIDNKIYINFKDYLSIIYTKEPEEENYLYQNAFKKRKALGVQTSAISLKVEQAILDPTGTIIHPLDFFSEGYWGFESFADTLPLDYQPDSQ